ncbi:hypothetical protein SLNWT_5950 [Streptomyces albus]|uniref:Uncharacterized protein n=1 Tax=Streptomyces albus (strain ATCC 21838 / DSM 41398 / FERM P-419 / JCM 4703 / NBRC 107858) TaxID=1081613 RepID=A0A0B5F622_STRA4|nr:hypothetical protein SLNWT_5950 [Streptomyces albus]AOU80628.1 hypothetical protein SLNHY_5937 [Streptomyces albus]
MQVNTLQYGMTRRRERAAYGCERTGHAHQGAPPPGPGGSGRLL